MTDRNATAIAAEAADSLLDAARQHKRLSAQHRRQAQELMRRRAALLAQAGIDLTPNGKAKEA